MGKAAQDQVAGTSDKDRGKPENIVVDLQAMIGVGAPQAAG